MVQILLTDNDSESPETPGDSPLPSRVNTPLSSNKQRLAANSTFQGSPAVKKKAITFDGYIEPDDLVPEYVINKAKLFELERPRQENKGRQAGAFDNDEDVEMARIRAKIDRIERDVLFDKYVAEQQWKTKRSVLEKDFATSRKQRARDAESSQRTGEGEPTVGADSEVNKEAERIAAEVLAMSEDDDDMAVADLFASLPVAEVDEVTGKTITVLNGKDGTKLIIRDFGKWTGIGPGRILDEACRSR